MQNVGDFIKIPNSDVTWKILGKGQDKESVPDESNYGPDGTPNYKTIFVTKYQLENADEVVYYTSRPGDVKKPVIVDKPDTKPSTGGKKWKSRKYTYYKKKKKQTRKKTTREKKKLRKIKNR